MGRPVFAVIVAAMLSACGAARKADHADRALALLRQVWDARDGGRVAGVEFYSASSADVPPHYLLGAAFDPDRALSAKREPALVRQLVEREIDPGHCGGGGLGAEYRAYDRPIPNPANTIYLYTTARVVMGLAPSSGADDQIPRDADCAIRTRFHFAPDRSHIAYSDQRADDGLRSSTTCSPMSPWPNSRSMRRAYPTAPIARA
jgi:hypothetical protein